MLQIVLSWKMYRSLKNGFLLDYYSKRLFFIFSKYFTIIFTIFFADKFILYHFFSNLSTALSLIFSKLTSLKQYSFLSLLKFTLFILFYLIITLVILWL